MDFREYEKFVAELYYAVITAESLTTNLKTRSFELNKRITNSYGVDREFDVYWEFELDGIVHNTVMECKNYNSNIPIEKLDALVTKLGDVSKVITPVFATKTGYQSGAIAAADHHKVGLLVVREQDDLTDWTAEDGKALIRHVTIEVNLCPPARIHNFAPTLVGDWVRKNTSIDISQPLSINELNNEIFIDDRTNQERYSLQDLAGRLVGGKSDGRFQEQKEFTDAYLETPNNGRLKMVSFSVEYSVFPPLRETIEIDFGDALVGVIEYLQKGEKKLIFKNKVNNTYHVRTE